MPKLSEVRPPYDLCGGHPALDLVNSLNNRFAKDGPRELLADYPDLLRFTVQTGLINSQHARRLAAATDLRAAARALRSARGLREAAAAALYDAVNGRSPAPAVVRTLERYFRGASEHHELRWGRSGFAWSWGRFETHAELPVWLLTCAVSELLMSPRMDRIRACGAQTCRWLFLDTSKNHTRRWCNMKVCGNRMKARRFQARSAQGQAPQ